MKKLIIKIGSHYSNKQHNDMLFEKIQDLIFSGKEKRIYNYFNTDKIYLDDTDGFISFQPTSSLTFYDWLTDAKIRNIVGFINKYISDQNGNNVTIWIGSLLVQESK